MNKDRRKEIARAVALVEEIRAQLDEARQAVEGIRDEEQDYFDNMPESLRGGDKGDRAQEAIDALENATSEMECVDLDGIVSFLEEAAA